MMKSNSIGPLLFSAVAAVGLSGVHHRGFIPPTASLHVSLGPTSPVYLLQRLLHGGALPLQLLHARLHRVHVHPQHLIQPRRRPPRRVPARRPHRRLLVLPSAVAGLFPAVTRPVGGEESSGNGVTELELLEKQHLHHRPQRQPLILSGINIDGPIEPVVEQSGVIRQCYRQIVKLFRLQVGIGGNFRQVAVDQFPDEHQPRGSNSDAFIILALRSNRGGSLPQSFEKKPQNPLHAVHIVQRLVQIRVARDKQIVQRRMLQLQADLLLQRQPATI
ncbi:peptidase S41 family protein [Striga asiatica]|uniref:Peptidase S41 family protein n=1 Tax=Striga asiatica TaxID=4170 RepID=A0A5A7PDV7_STRAF|nr:peptidase S41 family protein [Striga asiatica]